MERTQWICGLVGGVLCASVSYADVVLAPVERGTDQLMNANRFPESRFGRAPMKLDIGIGQAYASRHVQDLEAPDTANLPNLKDEDSPRESFFGNRAPAGLEVGQRQSGGAQVRPSSTAENPVAPPTSGKALSPQNLMSPASSLVRKGVQEVALIASDLGFFPKTVFVSRDVPVRMYVTGSSQNTLCIMMDSFQVRKQVRSQKIEEITFTPNTPGKFRFYCPVNGMEGTLVVREFATRVAEGE